MIKYKSPEVEREFNTPHICDARLFGLVHALARYVSKTMDKDIWLTDVARWTGRLDSPHRIHDDNPRSRAVDIRCHRGFFTENELAIIQYWLRDTFPRSDMARYEHSGATPIEGWIGISRRHGDGDHEHLHVTVEPRTQMWAAIGYTKLDVGAIKFDG